MNTPIQEAIEHYKLKLAEYPKKHNISQVDVAVHKSYIDTVKYLESLLQDEQKAFIDYGVDCQLGQNCNQDTIANALHKAVDIFDDTFSKS